MINAFPLWFSNSSIVSFHWSARVNIHKASLLAVLLSLLLFSSCFRGNKTVKAGNELFRMNTNSGFCLGNEKFSRQKSKHELRIFSLQLNYDSVTIFTASFYAFLCLLTQFLRQFLKSTYFYFPFLYKKIEFLWKFDGTSLKRQEDIIFFFKEKKKKSGMKKLARKDRKKWDETGFIDAFYFTSFVVSENFTRVNVTSWKPHIGKFFINCDVNLKFPKK